MNSDDAVKKEVEEQKISLGREEIEEAISRIFKASFSHEYLDKYTNAVASCDGLDSENINAVILRQYGFF